MLVRALPRLWFKRTLDYQERTPRARNLTGDGWAWLQSFEAQMDKVKAQAKKTSKRVKYTADSEYAQTVRAAKQAWYAKKLT